MLAPVAPEFAALFVILGGLRSPPSIFATTREISPLPRSLPLRGGGTGGEPGELTAAPLPCFRTTSTVMPAAPVSAVCCRP